LALKPPRKRGFLFLRQDQSSGCLRRLIAEPRLLAAGEARPPDELVYRSAEPVADAKALETVAALDGFDVVREAGRVGGILLDLGATVWSGPCQPRRLVSQ